MSVYIKFVYDVNKIIESCMASKNYSSLLQDVNIEEFLKIKYDCFDETYYLPVKAKLLEVEAS